ncbi:MAG: hypothetical protein GYB66_15070 [Chloroflexi bacterium]|nr:hypothetical protein [Chloroflexota bacterium]
MTSSLPYGHSSGTASPNRLWLVVLLLLLGATLRIHGAARQAPLHADEALFADFARQMVPQGDWNLDTVNTDKPPGTFFLVGTSFLLVGETSFAARFPNILASLISLAAFYGIAKRLSSRAQTGVLALGMLVVAPIDIRYAATVFQDPPMLAGVLLGIWLASDQKWSGAGFALGIATIMKPTALWALPLVIGIGLLHHHNLNMYWGHLLRRIGYFALGSAIPIGAIMLWDESRQAQSFIELGSHNNNPGRLIRSDEVWPRAESWLSIISDIAGSPYLAGIFLAAALFGLTMAVRYTPSRQNGTVYWFITVYLVNYLGIYWLVAFGIWDRYVYLIAPLLLLLAAAGSVALLARARRTRVLLLPTAMVILLTASMPASWQSTGQTDPDEMQGIATFSEVLNQDYAGHIVYDNWIGWHFRWYLGADPSIQVVYFPTPEDLALHLQDADAVRYLAAPSAEKALPWLHLLQQYQVRSEVAYQPSGSQLVLYRLYPPLLQPIFG